MSDLQVLELPENTKGRDFTVGDIHGCFDRLDEALAQAGFNPETDRLISVGDLVNRGAHSIRCLEYLQQPWFYAVAGNHEDMVIENIRDDGSLFFGDVDKHMKWLRGLDNDTRKLIKAAFQVLPTAIQVETKEGPMAFVHANIPPGMDWPSFREKLEAGDHKTQKSAKWSRKRIKGNFNEQVAGISRVYFGHTKMVSGARKLGNCFYIDTGAVYGERAGNAKKGFMTLIDITAPARKIARKPLFKKSTRLVC